MAGRDDFAGRSARLNVNLRQSVNSARALSFAVGEMSGKFNGAVNAAAALAENMAKVSRNARIAASASGIGALVAVLATIGVAAYQASKQIEAVKKQTAEVRKETEILQAKAAGDTRKATELEIALAMERELAAAKDLETILLKFPDLQAAIRQKAEAARQGAEADRERAFGNMRFDLGGPGFPSGSHSERAIQEAMRRAEIEREKQRRLREIPSDFLPAQADAIKLFIEERFQSDLRELAFDLGAPARQLGQTLGQTIAGGIADGIGEAIASGSIGEGFKALAGTMLAGLGSLLIEIGGRGLAASQLVSRLAAALASLDGGTGVAASLGLIALGGVLRGLGASMGGGRGSRGGGAGGFAGGTRQTIVDRGLINPLNPAPNTVGLQAIQPISVTAIVYGSPDDARWQRFFLETSDKALGRRG